MNSTTTRGGKYKHSLGKRLGQEAVLATIRHWRSTSGKKIGKWNDVKTIRSLRERAK